MDSFEYFLVTKQIGLMEPIDGILGLSRNHPFHIAPGEDESAGPLLVEHLADAGTINANKFSFYFQEPGLESWMDLGEPDLSHVKTGSSIVETQMIDPDFFWSFYNTGVAFGTPENAYAYEHTDGWETFI